MSLSDEDEFLTRTSDASLDALTKLLQDDIGELPELDLDLLETLDDALQWNIPETQPPPSAEQCGGHVDTIMRRYAQGKVVGANQAWVVKCMNALQSHYFRFIENTCRYGQELHAIVQDSAQHLATLQSQIPLLIEMVENQNRERSALHARLTSAASTQQGLVSRLTTLSYEKKQKMQMEALLQREQAKIVARVSNYKLYTIFSRWRHVMQMSRTRQLKELKRKTAKLEAQLDEKETLLEVAMDRLHLARRMVTVKARSTPLLRYFYRWRMHSRDQTVLRLQRDLRTTNTTVLTLREEKDQHLEKSLFLQRLVDAQKVRAIRHQRRATMLRVMREWAGYMQDIYRERRMGADAEMHKARKQCNTKHAEMLAWREEAKEAAEHCAELRKKLLFLETNFFTLRTYLLAAQASGTDSGGNIAGKPIRTGGGYEQLRDYIARMEKMLLRSPRGKPDAYMTANIDKIHAAAVDALHKSGVRMPGEQEVTKISTLDTKAISSQSGWSPLAGTWVVDVSSARSSVSRPRSSCDALGLSPRPTHVGRTKLYKRKVVKKKKKAPGKEGGGDSQ
eukprot:Rmarinus@m.27825